MMDRNKIRAPEISDAEIISKAESLTKKHASLIPFEIATLQTSFDSIFEGIIYSDYGVQICEDVDLGFDEAGAKILGEYEVLSNTVSIDATIGRQTKDPRRSFTLWHEVGGHAILQGDWLRRQIKRAERTRIVTTETSIAPETVDILERQANLFAANAGVPMWLLKYRMHKVFNFTRPLVYNRPAKYSLEVYGSTRYYDVNSYGELCRIVAHHVQPSFGGMSKECIGYQVEKTGCVVNRNRARTFPLRRTQQDYSNSTVFSRDYISAGAVLSGVG